MAPGGREIDVGGDLLGEKRGLNCGSSVVVVDDYRSSIVPCERLAGAFGYLLHLGVVW